MFSIGNTSSIRVHFPASYVRLPEWTYICFSLDGPSGAWKLVHRGGVFAELLIPAKELGFLSFRNDGSMRRFVYLPTWMVGFIVKVGHISYMDPMGLEGDVDVRKADLMTSKWYKWWWFRSRLIYRPGTDHISHLGKRKIIFKLLTW